MSFEPKTKVRSGDFEVWHVGPNHYTIRDRAGIQKEFDPLPRITQYNHAFNMAASFADMRKQGVIE